MIKLIATDMDGTLLDENGRLPKEFFSTLEKLKEKNIKFVIASGRPYATLYENFKPYSEDLEYICDNGSYIVLKDKEHIIKHLDRNVVNSIIKVSENIPNVELILCGIKGVYHKPCSQDFLNEIDKYYVNKHIVEDLASVDDVIYKIAVCDLNNSADNSYKILNPLFGEDNKVVISGALWVDVTEKNVNKGAALKQIQEDHNISYEETMVFGDFYNDIEMLKEAHYSFVMENANEDMKQYGNFTAKSNKEAGVIQAINEYVLKEETAMV